MVPLLKRCEVAELLQKKESWLRYAERKRLIPFVRVGQQIRYRQADVDAWIRRQTVRSSHRRDAR